MCTFVATKNDQEFRTRRRDRRVASFLRILRWPWVLYAMLLVGLTAVYQLALSSHVQELTYPAFTLAAAVGIVVGIVINKPERRLPFFVFAGGSFAWAIADTIYSRYEMFFGTEIPFPSIADIFYISSYLCWTAGIVLLIRRRQPDRDVGGWIDTAIAIVALALVEFVFLIYPYFTSPDSPLLARVVSAGYPVADLLIIGVLCRLLVVPGSRTMSYRFIVAGFFAVSISDAAYGVVILKGAYETGAIDLGWFLGFILFGMAMFHPSVRTFALPQPDAAPRLSTRRLIILGGLALVAPALYLVSSPERTPMPVAVAIATGGAMLFVLVTVRMGRLVRKLDRAMSEIVVAQEARDKLLRQTLRSAEDERSILAADLHDGPLQRLTALMYRAQSIKGSASAAEIDARALAVREAVAGEIADVRRMMTTLRPGALVERGLDGALADYAMNVVAGTSTTCAVDVELSERLDLDLETLIYRITQDAINLAMRAPSVSTVSVSVHDEDRGVRLTVHDDGRSDGDRLDEDAIRAFRLQERVEMVDGEFSMTSDPSGTTMLARFPIGEAA